MKAKHFGDSYRGRRKFNREFQDFRQQRTYLEQVEAAAARAVAGQMEGPPEEISLEWQEVSFDFSQQPSLTITSSFIMNPDGSYQFVRSEVKKP